jgi:hypothetical protein
MIQLRDLSFPQKINSENIWVDFNWKTYKIYAPHLMPYVVANKLT